MPAMRQFSEASLSDEAKLHLRKIKFALILMMIGTGVRIMVGDLNCFVDVCAIIMGIFLLRTDPTFLTCYAFLVNSICRMCCSEGGLRLLVPFSLICAVNGFFNFILFFCLPLNAIVTYAYLLSSTGALTAAYYGYQVFKELSPLVEAEIGQGGYFGGPQGFRGMNQPLMGDRQRDQRSYPAQAPAQQHFTLFGGEGRRLVDDTQTASAPAWNGEPKT